MRTELDYKDKIRKLLALAESPNEHEAKAALLKAREMMAEHKLTKAELTDTPQKNVKRILTGITCSKRRNPWIINLSAVIGENYCCEAFRSRVKRKQTWTVGFIGFEDDTEICEMVFKYAVDSILSHNAEIRQWECWRCVSEITEFCDSYGFGFSNGVSEAFRKQQESNEDSWGLVLVTPKEVEEAASSLGNQVFKPRALDSIHENYYFSGFQDGKQFDPTHRLAEA